MRSFFQLVTPFANHSKYLGDLQHFFPFLFSSTTASSTCTVSHRGTRRESARKNRATAPDSQTWFPATKPPFRSKRKRTSRPPDQESKAFRSRAASLQAPRKLRGTRRHRKRPSLDLPAGVDGRGSGWQVVKLETTYTRICTRPVRQLWNQSRASTGMVLLSCQARRRHSGMSEVLKVTS